MAAKTIEERKAVLDEKIQKELEKLEKLKKDREKLERHLTYRDAARLVKAAGYTPYDILEAFRIPIPDEEEEQSAESENAEETEN